MNYNHRWFCWCSLIEDTCTEIIIIFTYITNIRIKTNLQETKKKWKRTEHYEQKKSNTTKEKQSVQKHKHRKKMKKTTKSKWRPSEIDIFTNIWMPEFMANIHTQKEPLCNYNKLNRRREEKKSTKAKKVNIIIIDHFHRFTPLKTTWCREYMRWIQWWTKEKKIKTKISSASSIKFGWRCCCCHFFLHKLRQH